MSFLTGWFKKHNDEDYEKILSTLALDIDKRKTKLSELRLRERRSTLVTTFYTLALWGAYVSLWYVNFIPNVSGVEKVVAGVPVIIGPIIILFIRRIVQIWYKSKGDAEEKILLTLLKQQRNIVEEVKKKTNYYSTRNLIERYDDPSASPLRGRVGPSQPQPLPLTTPQRPSPNSNSILQTPSVPGGLRVYSSPPASVPPQPLPIPRKQWYDKLVDALLGDDDQPGDGATRFALICEKCFTHNGLVKENLWEDAQYVCPKCGHFNPSLKARKQGVSSPLPSSLFSLPLTSLPPSSIRHPRSLSSPPSPALEPSVRRSRIATERDSPEVDEASAEKNAQELDVTEGISLAHMDVD